MFRIYSKPNHPVSSTSPQYQHSHSTASAKAESQYDHIEISPQPGGEQQRVRHLAGQLAQEVRTHISSRDLDQIKQQISSGEYQPSSRKIASSILLMRKDD